MRTALRRPHGTTLPPSGKTAMWRYEDDEVSEPDDVNNGGSAPWSNMPPDVPDPFDFMAGQDDFFDDYDEDWFEEDQPQSPIISPSTNTNTTPPAPPSNIFGPPSPPMQLVPPQFPTPPVFFGPPRPPHMVSQGIMPGDDSSNQNQYQPQSGLHNLGADDGPLEDWELPPGLMMGGFGFAGNDEHPEINSTFYSGGGVETVGPDVGIGLPDIQEFMVCSSLGVFVLQDIN